jgi:integrase
MTVPTPRQVDALLAAADDRFAAFIAICAFGGLRLGEAAALQVSEVDLLRRRLLINRQVQRGPGGSVELRAPKHGSERTIVVPDRLLNLVAATLSSTWPPAVRSAGCSRPALARRRARTPLATSGGRRPPRPASAASGCTTSGTFSPRGSSHPGATSSPFSERSGTPRRPRP